MKIKDISQPQKLTITGIALPYIVIIVMAGIIITMPETGHEKKDKIGAIAYILPFIAASIGAILVGIGSLQKTKLERKKKSLILAFLFGSIWTAIFHIFITLYFFMMIVYGYAGLIYD